MTPVAVAVMAPVVATILGPVAVAIMAPVTVAIMAPVTVAIMASVAVPIMTPVTVAIMAPVAIPVMAPVTVAVAVAIMASVAVPIMTPVTVAVVAAIPISISIATMTTTMPAVEVARPVIGHLVVGARIAAVLDRARVAGAAANRREGRAVRTGVIGPVTSAEHAASLAEAADTAGGFGRERGAGVHHGEHRQGRRGRCVDKAPLHLAPQGNACVRSASGWVATFGSRSRRRTWGNKRKSDANSGISLK
jgi:hypothetical protein